MEDIVARIKKIIDDADMLPSEFADQIEVGRPLLSHVLTGRNNPSLHLIIEILRHYPEISADWLILGKKPSVSQEETSPEKPIIVNSEPLPVAPSPEKSPISSDKLDILSEKLIVLHPDKTFETYTKRS